MYHFLTTTYALLEREGWWLKKNMLCLPKKGDKITRKLWVTEVTYMGNSKTFRSNDLDNNWSCTLDTKPPVDGEKTSAGVSPATKPKGRGKRRRAFIPLGGGANAGALAIHTVCACASMYVHVCIYICVLSMFINTFMCLYV